MTNRVCTLSLNKNNQTCPVCGKPLTKTDQLTLISTGISKTSNILDILSNAFFYHEGCIGSKIQIMTRETEEKLRALSSVIRHTGATVDKQEINKFVISNQNKSIKEIIKLWFEKS